MGSTLMACRSALSDWKVEPRTVARADLDYDEIATFLALIFSDNKEKLVSKQRILCAVTKDLGVPKNYLRHALLLDAIKNSPFFSSITNTDKFDVLI